MRDVTVVFPSRRAGLFLNQELSARCTQPVWAPRYVTMGELFQSFSPLSVADPIDCICLLHELYLRHVGEFILQQEGPDALERETLDRFWGWGEVLMADFDDIDKHMADARKVFSHVHDLAELQDLSYLDEDQRRALVRFFGYFSSGKDSLLRQRFIRLWDQMYPIYTSLRDTLLANSQLWEGALQRQVCSDIETNPQLLDAYPHICFVGFCVLNDTEEYLMNALRPRALFYWDYDEYYTRDEKHEAGEFMRRNLQRFPSALPPQMFRNLEQLHEITFISCNTDNAASRYVSNWLQGPLDPYLPKNAAILCNENLLLPVLHAIPDAGQPGSPSALNITMGFPLSQTPIYSFLIDLFSLQADGWDSRRHRFRPAFLQPVQNHPYAAFVSKECLLNHPDPSVEGILSWLDEVVQAVGLHYAQVPEPTIYEQLCTESVFQAHRILMRLLQMVQRPVDSLSVQLLTLRRLLRTLLAGVRIPFHGEPADGMQIMGVLETRCLDFSHLLILSVEEGYLPRPSHQDSLIPPVVRESYGLTTPRHRISVYAYYFYRLIQRSEFITCVFNENCTGIQHHEISRFLRQLQAELPPEQLTIHQFNLQSVPQITKPSEICIPTSPQVLERLKSTYCRTAEVPKPSRLSPTALNRYMQCPLHFYFRYVADLQPPEEETDEMDASQLGNVFHDSAEIIYADLIQRHGGQRTVQKDWLRPLLEPGSATLRRYVDIAFELNVFHPSKSSTDQTNLLLKRVGGASEKERKERIAQMLRPDGMPQCEYQGQAIIIRDVVLQYLRALLRHDLHRAPFTLLGMEQDCNLYIPVECGEGEPISVQLGGRIDRIDKDNDGIVRILDYKTGRSHTAVLTFDQLFSHGAAHPDHEFQTFIYALAYGQSMPNQHDSPLHTALFYVREAHKTEFDPNLSIRIGDGPTAVRVTDFRQLEEQFRQELSRVIAEIFDPRVPFSQTADTNLCARCDYRLLCGRHTKTAG